MSPRTSSSSPSSSSCLILTLGWRGSSWWWRWWSLWCRCGWWRGWRSETLRSQAWWRLLDGLRDRGTEGDDFQSTTRQTTSDKSFSSKASSSITETHLTYQKIIISSQHERKESPQNCFRSYFCLTKWNLHESQIVLTSRGVVHTGRQRVVWQEEAARWGGSGRTRPLRHTSHTAWASWRSWPSPVPDTSAPMSFTRQSRVTRVQVWVWSGHRRWCWNTWMSGEI